MNYCMDCRLLGRTKWTAKLRRDPLTLAGLRVLTFLIWFYFVFVFCFLFFVLFLSVYRKLGRGATFDVLGSNCELLLIFPTIVIQFKGKEKKTCWFWSSNGFFLCYKQAKTISVCESKTSVHFDRTEKNLGLLTYLRYYAFLCYASQSKIVRRVHLGISIFSLFYLIDAWVTKVSKPPCVHGKIVMLIWLCDMQTES